MTSSVASSNCRIDWRPSRWLVCSLVTLGVLAGGSLLLSALPAAVKGPAALVALLQGLRLARREWARPGLVFAWDGGDAPARLLGPGDPQVLAGPGLHLRGPMAAISGSDARGRRRHLVWWPDTLPSASRRQLRLAAGVSRRYETAPPSVAA